MQAVSGQIEDLYLQHSRADVTENLVQLISSACVTPVLTPDRLSMELMMLVAILHGNVGSEVGMCRDDVGSKSSNWLAY